MSVDEMLLIELLVDEMTVHEMLLIELLVDEMSVDEMLLIEFLVDEMSVDEMLADKMSVDESSWHLYINHLSRFHRWTKVKATKEDFYRCRRLCTFYMYITANAHILHILQNMYKYVHFYELI
jgi:hypothetical protein